MIKTIFINKETRIILSSIKSNPKGITVYSAEVKSLDGSEILPLRQAICGSCNETVLGSVPLE